MTVGERIKSSRESKNMTQEMLGTLCGTTKQTIFKYENGIVTNIPLDRLERIADALGVSAAYLMGWEYDDDTSAEITLALEEEVTADHATGRDSARNAMLKTHGTEHTSHITRFIGDKSILLYYHPFEDNAQCMAASALLSLLEQMSPDDAENLCAIAEGYAAADRRARHMVDYVLDPFKPLSLDDALAGTDPEEPMPDAETIALARQILQDKRAEESGSASSGEAGSKKMA